MKKELYSVIIPTMWAANSFLIKMLNVYENNSYIKEVIIINNKKENTPDLNKFKKVKLINVEKNIYVNPAWNLGVKEASSEKIIISNDDIYINPLDFEKLINVIEDNLKPTQIYGPSTRCYETSTSNIIIHEALDQMNYGYGTMMWMYKNDYITIPEKMKIYCGDSILFKFNNHYNFSGVHIQTFMSTTVKSIDERKYLCDVDLIEYKKYLKEHLK